jgi:ferredoxin
MEIKQVTLVYFSPTGTSRTVLESIAKGIAIENVEHINLTLPEGARQAIPHFSDELVIVGAPVYGGRLPVVAIERLKQLKANDTPAVLIVLYGNREFEDALLELKHLTLGLGFRPVAAGAFIGEHSFATKDIPIANGRPNGEDVQVAIDFGKQIRDKVTALQSHDGQTDLKIPGRFPYVAGGARSLAVSPVTNENICTLCGTCAGVCPTAAISIDENVATEIELCIRCCACIKNCPAGARVMNDSTMIKLANNLSLYFSYPKEPRIFGIERM